MLRQITTCYPDYSFSATKYGLILILTVQKVGSDHLALVSEFAFTQDNHVGEGTLVATSRM